MASMLSLAFISGALMDQYDARILLVIASVLMSLGLLLGSFAESLPALFACVALAGASSSVHIQAAAVIQPWFDRKKGLATGIAMAGSGLGNFVLALVLGAFFTTTPDRWREALRWESMWLLVFSIPASLLLKKRPVVACPEDVAVEKDVNLLSLELAGGSTNGSSTPPSPPLPPSPPPSPSPPPLVTLTSLVCQRRMIFMSLSKGVSAFAYGVPFVHLVPLMSDLSIGESQQALALALIGLASLLGRVVLGVLSDRMGHVRLFQFGMLQLALSMFVMPHCGSTVSFSLISFYYGFWAGGHISLPPSIISLWYHDQPSHVGKLVGVNFCADTIGAFLGPVIVGALYDVQGNYNVAFSVMGIFFLTANGFACLMPKAMSSMERLKEEHGDRDGDDMDDVASTKQVEVL